MRNKCTRDGFRPAFGDVGADPVITRSPLVQHASEIRAGKATWDLLAFSGGPLFAPEQAELAR